VTAPFATATVKASLDWGNLDAEFEARVRAAAVKATEAAEKHFKDIEFAAQVRLDANTGVFGHETQERLNLLHLEASVSLDADTGLFSTDTQARLNTLSLSADVTLKADKAQLQADLAALSAEVPVKLDVSATEIASFVTTLNAKLAAADIVAPVHLDIANAAQYEALIAHLTQPRTQVIHIQTVGGGSGGGSGVAGLDLSLSNVTRKSAKLAGIAALIGAIGGAAGVAAGAVGALVVGLSGVGIAGVAGLGTTLLGLQGIGKAFTALNDVADSSGKDAEAQAKAVASATKQVEQAERGVRDAKKDARRAEEDLTRARKVAKDQIDELNFSLKGAALDEKDAAIALREAQAELRRAKLDPTADSTDRDRARLNVERALLRQEEVGRKNKKLAEEAADANVKGVEGSDEVVQAKERMEDANERVADSQRSLIEANDALRDALTATSSAVDKSAEALGKLSPNARAFVLAMMALKPQFVELRNIVQDNMFADLDSVFTDLITTSMPMLQDGLGGVATSINGAAKEFAGFWASAEAQDSLRNIFAGTAELITAMQPGLAALTGGILDIGNAAAPVMDQLGASLGNLLGEIGAAFSEAFESGALTELFTVFSTMMDGLGGGLNALLGGLIEFGNIVGPVLGPLLQTLGESIAALAPSLGALGVTFGDALIVVLPVLSQFISALADGLTPIMPVLAQLLKALGAALTPLIPPLSQILQTVGTALVGAINALAPAIGPLGEAFASLVNALAPILPLVAEVVGMLVSALAPALTTIFNAFAPVIQQLVEQLRPVFERLAPILADVAMQLGIALADAINQLSPVLPIIIDGFIRIVDALAPFLPQLVQIWADYLPKFLDLLVYLAENVLPPVITALEWLIQNVLPYVIEGLRFFVETVGDKFVAVKNTLEGAKENIKNAVDGIKGFFTDLGDKVRGVWDSIVDKIKSAVGTVAGLLKSYSESSWPLPFKSEAGNLANNLIAWSESKAMGGVVQAGQRSSGVLFGPGTGRSDDILGLDASGLPTARVAHGEMLINKEQTDRNLPLLTAINAGWTPSPELLRAAVYGLPGHAGGGIVGGGAVPSSTVTAPAAAGVSAGKQLNREQWIALFGNAAEFDRLLAEQNARNQQQLAATEKQYVSFGQTVTGVLGGLQDEAFPRHMEGLNEVAKSTLGTTEDGQKNWNKLGATVGAVSTGMLDGTFPALRQGLDGVGQFARGVVDGVGGDFNRMPGLTAPPINWIIDKIINTGMRDAWMGVKSAIPDLPDWPGAAPLIQGFYTGGIMSGYSPGRDDRVIAVGGGEAIMRPEWTRAVGPDYVHSMNAAARSGGVSAVQKLAGAYASGGIVQPGAEMTSDIQRSMWDAVRTAFPQAVLTSGTRYQDVGSGFDFHMAGQAIDLGGPMQQIANWIDSRYPDALELFWDPGPNRDEGRPTGPIGGHSDHVHWAMSQMVDSDGKLIFAGGGSSGGRVGARSAALAGFDAAMSGLRQGMPNFGPAMFGQLPGTMFDSISRAASAEIGKFVRGGNAVWDVSAGAEQWRQMMIDAYRNQGYEPTPEKIDAWIRQIDTESHGDPNIAQQIVDVNGTGEAAGVGLGQMIPTTWASYRDPSLPDNRRDPWAMTNAMVRYGEQKYGDSLLDVIGHGHGYDQGGIANGIGLLPKWTIKPERVLSPEMTPIFERLVEVLERPEIATVLRMLDPSTALTPIAAPELAIKAVEPAPANDPLKTAAQGAATEDAYDVTEGYDSKNLRSQLGEFGRVIERWRNGEADMAAGEAWLADNDFSGSVEQWAVNAFKEITGQFADPVGLRGLWGQEVDGWVKDQKLAAIDANDAAVARGEAPMFAKTVNFYGMDPGKVGDEVIRAMLHGMAPVTQTYRKG
jgi:phage-related protein